MENLIWYGTWCHLIGNNYGGSVHGFYISIFSPKEGEKGWKPMEDGESVTLKYGDNARNSVVVKNSGGKPEWVGKGVSLDGPYPEEGAFYREEIGRLGGEYGQLPHCNACEGIRGDKTPEEYYQDWVKKS